MLNFYGKFMLHKTETWRQHFFNIIEDAEGLFKKIANNINFYILKF